MQRYAAWVAFVERRYRAILVVSLIVTLASALSLAALRFDFDVLSLLPTGAPAFDNFKTFVADFGHLDEWVIVVECNDAAVIQGFADTFTARLERLDTVGSVQGKLDPAQIQQGILGPFLYNYVPASEYAQLAGRLTPEGLDAQVTADRAILQAPFDLSGAQWVRRDPLLLTPLAARALGAAFDAGTLNLSGRYLSTSDGTRLLIMVRPRHSAFDIAFTTHFMGQVREAEHAARAATPGATALRVGYTGSYAFALEDAATLKRDIRKYTVLALVGVLAVFYAGYRNFRILPFVTYPLALTTFVTFAASLLCYAQLNAVSISFAAILYGLSIDSGIYYYTRVLQELREHDLREAVTRTLVNLGGANVVASTTTAAAFVVIGFSELEGVSQLGFLTAIGMLINIVQFFVLYPALTFFMPRTSLRQAPLDTPRLGRLAGASVSRAAVVAVSALLIGLALLFPALRVDFDVDLTNLRPANSPAFQVQQEIAAHFGAQPTTGAVLVRAATLEEALQGSEAVAGRLAAYADDGLVRTSRGITALLPSGRTQRERLALFNQLPRQQVLQDLRVALERHGFVARQFDDFFAEFGRVHETIVQPGDAALQPFASVIARHVRQRDTESIVATYVEPAPGVSLNRIAERLHADLGGVQLIVASRALLEEELGRQLRRELIAFCLASFVLNVLLVLWNFPQLSTACTIVAPEALVIVCILGLMRLAGLGIDPVNLIVIPLILGIGVDNCVYVAARYRRGEPLDAAVRHGGRALSLSALATMTGFGFLGLSHYPALSRMGLLAATSLFLCLVATVTVLPALLRLLARLPNVGQRLPEYVDG